ncbi:uncharacterized protein BYT42DRAFT_576649 [Radiomyces spectabilis]|uniref:uncharacterized protein n=1 Tax=Radiomyces spectabilis TaxID=64574 RepID=UPI00221F979A|nr:uncharacterized protein BYT42DRAFT_576649 [Radiomyces spectabilis]KAI8374516.1 hypothetical protein BYT42DRAFT_576649 [Radiomyces spectabilis]
MSNEHSLPESTFPVRPPQRRLLNKYATIATDKYPNNLRRELLLSKFDRNLTVEKAHFQDPGAHTDDSLPRPSYHDHDAPSPSIHAAPSPTSIAHLSNTGHALSNVHNSHGSSIEPSRIASSASETERHGRTFLKKKKRPVNGTASPAEVFHRNLVDAVSNVEGSEENERYVYPYSNNNSNEHEHTVVFGQPVSDDGLATEDDEEEDEEHRPKLRNYVRGYPYRSSKRDPTWQEHGSLNPWRTSPHRVRRTPRRYKYTDGYASDDEGILLLPTDYRTDTKQQGCFPYQHTIGYGLLVLFLLAWMIIYRAKPLSDVAIEMGRVLASDKELIFDLHMQANNWNYWTVQVVDADISVFVFSQIVPGAMWQNDSVQVKGADPAEYLGSFYRFDEPLAIPPVMFSNEPAHAISQIRIKSPGDDKSGNERWSRIIRYPYGLITRGVLKYQLFPYFASYQSVAICDIAHVDPTTGIVSASPDQSYCLTEETVASSDNCNQPRQ